MNEDLSQPFCIIGSKGKWPDRYKFYLPPLEDMPEMDFDERLEVLEKQVGLLKLPNLTAKQNDTINQLRLDREHFWKKLNTLKEKLNKLFEKKKQKGSKYSYK